MTDGRDNSPNGIDTYNIYNENGKPKKKGWSISSFVCSLVSIVLAAFGWSGIVFGVVCIVFALISRKSLGYFDNFSLAGLLIGIFGIVFGTSGIIISHIAPEFWAGLKSGFIG